MRVKIRRLDAQAFLPEYAHGPEEDAGLDLRAAADAVLAPGEPQAVGTGLAIELPPGFEAQVRPRSGLALKNGVTLPNTPGTIDADYRGEIRVILLNLGDGPFTVKRGDRIAQLIVAPVVRVRWAAVDRLSDTRRGDGGFGHTGV